MSKKKGFGKFLIGAGIGAGLSLLFAPKNGGELRKDLKKKMDDLIDKARDVDVDEVRDNIEAKIVQLKDEITSLDKEKVLNIAKKKARQVQDLSEELVDYAVSKGTPVLKGAAESVRQKAIDVTKDVLNKLEKNEK